MSARLPAEVCDQVAALLRTGSSVAQVAAALGISETSCRRAARALDAPTDARAQTRAEVDRLLGQRLPATEIATRTGYSAHAVRLRARKIGAGKIRKKRHLTEVEIRPIAQLFAGGVPIPQIAQQVGLPVDSIHSLIADRRRRKDPRFPLRAPPRAEVLARAAQARAKKVERERAELERKAICYLAGDDARWLAGVVDARGTIGVSAGQLFFVVDSLNRALPLEIWTVTGQRGQLNRRSVTRRNQRGGWRWSEGSQPSVRAILRAIKPYVRARRELLDLVLSCPATDGTPETEARQKDIERKIWEWRQMQDVVEDG